MTTETYDVVVVGGGGAGLAAAIEARRLGRDVVLIEKNPALGGSTAWSIGSVSATATPHQIRKGIKDGPDGHYEDMPGFAGPLAGRDNDELRRILCDGMPDTFRWLLSHGIRFFGPMPEPPHKQPRMHNVLPNARAYIYHLEGAARRAGVVVRPSTRAARLIAESGRVAGVECETSTGTVRFMAHGGVVLGAGDFTSSPELKRAYMGEREAAVAGVNPTATGDGQRLAMAVGGQIVNGDLALGPEIRFVPPARQNLVGRIPPWTWLAELMAWSLEHVPDVILRPFVMSFLTTALAPSPALFQHGAVLVNGEGRRFTDELAQPAYDIPAQPGGVAYILVDGRLARQFSDWPHFISTAPGIAYAYMPDYRRNRPDVYREAPSLAALAGRIGAAGDVLARAISDHNAQLGSEPGERRPLVEPPFTALGPVRAVFVHNEGGLAVDTFHRVLDGGNVPIPGLYAAGATGQGGLLLKGHGHHLAWAFVSGRRAGRIAALATASPPTVI
ncbi:MAG: FAD-dependent oxidoreductase [Hyphomicrobiaceae bacterium]|nr:FAD-dependent oxidoreductase [Hyphomicrobiaceae bacterium]